MASKALLIELCIILLVSFEGAGNISAQVSQELARSIMGKNFLGVEEVLEHFDIQLTEEELARVPNIPFSEPALRQCRDSHILFLGVGRDRKGRPLTIERLRDMFAAESQPRFRSYPKRTQADESYATKETPHPGWYLVAKCLREETRSKAHWQQNKMLKENEYREPAVVYVYMMLLMFKARGERLFQKELVWCKGAGSDGAPVAAGYFDRDGIYVSDWWLRRDRHFGSAPARKADFP